MDHMDGLLANALHNVVSGMKTTVTGCGVPGGGWLHGVIFVWARLRLKIVQTSLYMFLEGCVRRSHACFVRPFAAPQPKRREVPAYALCRERCRGVRNCCKLNPPKNKNMHVCSYGYCVFLFGGGGVRTPQGRLSAPAAISGTK